VRAVHTASDAIRQQAASSEEMAGMGATCAVAWLIGSRLYTATVGDSRIYLIRGGRIQRISTDHTWVQEALENGYIQPEDIRGHPNAHVIRRYLGSPYLPEVDLRLRLSGQENDEQAAANQGLTLAPGDRILLTSDGLTDLVSDQEILAAYLNRSPEEASQSLIDLSNARGGHDNITLVSFSAPDQSVQLPVPVQKTRSNSRGLRWVLAGCAGTLAVVALIGLVVGGWWLMNGGAVGSRVTPTLTPTVAPAILSSPTPQVLPPSTPQRTVAPLPTDTPTRIPLLPGGPTLTPWPTNTPRTP
ncbi:MAG: protein phosphatase 2C domain-containing protein, partial [Anaerolineae bacterium]|nr:protein phosphatase 2C domain-containing protein [Anaerolineae bacterium]